jgi:predicted nucleotidyltransferase
VKTRLLDDVAAVNLPRQFGLLQKAIEVISCSSAVHSLHVRGSLAAGTADRLSDLDFIVAVHDTNFGPFLRIIDTLMSTEVGALLPGWRDTIVARMGGLGYVFLVPYDGGLHQIDLYAVPVSRLDTVLARTKAMPVYQADSERSERSSQQVTWLINSTLDRPYTTQELLVEIMVLGHMIDKRIARGQRYVAYSEMFALNTAAKNLIKTALAPSSAFYGWYHLAEEIGTTPIGRQCLADLDQLISGQPIPDSRALTAALTVALELAERAAPEAVAALRPAITAYWHYLEQM